MKVETWQFQFSSFSFSLQCSGWASIFAVVSVSSACVVAGVEAQLVRQLREIDALGAGHVLVGADDGEGEHVELLASSAGSVTPRTISASGRESASARLRRPHSRPACCARARISARSCVVSVAVGLRAPTRRGESCASTGSGRSRRQQPESAERATLDRGRRRGTAAAVAPQATVRHPGTLRNVLVLHACRRCPTRRRPPPSACWRSGIRVCPVRNLVARRARLRPERPSVPVSTTPKTSADVVEHCVRPSRDEIRAAPTGGSTGKYRTIAIDYFD